MTITSPGAIRPRQASPFLHAAHRWIAAWVVVIIALTRPGDLIGQQSSNTQASGSAITPLLALDPEGHNGWVADMVRYSYQNQLISVSHDKTIRFWSIDTGEPLRVLRPAIDRGDAGRLCAVAISPDETLLAVGGYAALRDPRDCRVMLISLPEGQIVRTLAGATGPIRTLAFSPDGTMLASAGDDAIIRLYDPTTGKQLRSLAGHADRIYSVAWSPDSKRLISGSWDDSARVWSASGQALFVLGGHRRSILCVDWSKDGRLLASGSCDKSIRIWNSDGSLRQIVTPIDNELSHLAFSPDSRSLLYAWGSRTSDVHGSAVLDVATGQERCRFNRHSNTPMCGVWLQENQIATASASGDVCVWSPENGQLIRRMVSRGRSVAAVGWSPDGRAVAWSHSSSTGSVIKGTVPLQHSFCLAALDFGPPPDASFVHSRESYGDLHIERTSNFVVSVWRSGRLISQYRLTHLDDRVRCRSILSGQRAVVGSDYGTVVFDANTGRAIYGLPGHTDSVWAISPSPNNRYLLTGSHDQTLEIWNTDTYEHLLSLFFCGSEWIVWSPKGYYAASVGGERLMGWHINRGPDTLADYYPAANFHDSLYRPDVIRRIVEAGGFKAAWQQADEERERSSEPRTIAAILPPTVTLRRIESGDESTDAVRISATAMPSGKETIKRLRVLVDGRPGESYVAPLATVADSTGSPLRISHEFAVPLTQGEHIITVKADTGASFGISPPLEVAIAKGEARKPKLYVLAIGGGSYADSSWRIDHAAGDAAAIARRFAADKLTIYSAIETHVLTGGQATSANVLAALEAMRQRMTPADVGVVFLEGRGGNDAGTERLRFFTADSQRSVTGGGISAEELKQFVERTPGRLMIWADIRRATADTTRAEVNYCESQMAASHQDGGFALYDFLRELADADHGAVVMGTTGQVPDSSKAVGTFAEAILAGLSAEADTDANGTVLIGEFESAVRDHVSAASAGRQRAIQASPTDARSFPLIAP